MYPLAAQSVYSKLVVKKTVARTDDFQELTKKHFHYYDIAKKLTKADPAEYAIQNLSNTVYSLPKGSIFDTISFLPHDIPDFRMVPVEGSKKRIVLTDGDDDGSGYGGTPTVVTPPDPSVAAAAAASAAAGANSAVESHSIFKEFAIRDKKTAATVAAAAVVEAAVPCLGDTSDTDIQRLLDLGPVPLVLDETAVKTFLGNDYTTMEMILVDSGDAAADNVVVRTKKMVMVTASTYLNVPQDTVVAVITSQNMHRNKHTLKVGILYNLIMWTDNAIVSRMTDDYVKALAQLISNAVDRAA